MSLSLRFAARSHVGLIREGNEDSGYASSRLLVIADGMGGQAAGEIASAVAAETLAELDAPGTTGLTGDPVRDLGDRVKLANTRIRTLITQQPELEGMGCTLTALFLAGPGHLAFAHIGDSRAYRLRGGTLEQISTDHTWVQRLIDEGQITEEEAERHPQRSLLMRALGTTAEVDLDLTVLDLQPGDRYLLCSDGLSGFVSFNALVATLTGYGDLHEAAETLIQHALRGGGADNITCIVADAFDPAGPGGAPQTQSEDTQYLELPVFVGAAEEARAAGTSPFQTGELPAVGGSDPALTGMIGADALAALSGEGEPAQSAAPVAASASMPGPQGPAGPVPGQAPPEMPMAGQPRTTDTAELEAIREEPKARKRWVKPAAIAGTCAVVLGAALGGGYLWTQQQYYVAADSNGDVAIYQGVDFSLAGLGLSHVYDSEKVTVAGLPTPKQSAVRSSITANSLSDAQSIVSTLGDLETACAALSAEQKLPTTLTPGALFGGVPTNSGSPSADATQTAPAAGKTTPAAGTHTSASPGSTGSKAPSAPPSPSTAATSPVGSDNSELLLSAQCPSSTD